MLMLGFGEGMSSKQMDVMAKDLGFIPGMPFEYFWPILCKIAYADVGNVSFLNPDDPSHARIKGDYKEMYEKGMSLREMFNMMY